MENNQSSFRDEVKSSEKSEWQGLVITAIIGIILGCIIGYLVFGRGIFNPAEAPVDTSKTGAETVVPAATSATNTSIPATGTMTIVADDQEPGTSVRLSRLALATGAWVVTFTSTEDESRPERIIGAQYFNPGTYTNVTAYVAEGIVAGRTYFVTFYGDDAVRGSTTPGGHVFNSLTDRPLVQNGNWIMDSFKVASVGSRG